MNACSYCGYFGFNLVSQEFLSCLLLCASVFVIVTKEEIFAVAALIIIFSHISWKRSKCTGPELCLMTHCWRREQLVQQSQMNSSVFFCSYYLVEQASFGSNVSCRQRMVFRVFAYIQETKNCLWSYS